MTAMAAPASIIARGVAVSDIVQSISGMIATVMTAYGTRSKRNEATRLPTVRAVT